MSDKTAIEWTDATWNPIVGCSVVSPGCTNCYAMKLAGTRLREHPSRAGLTTMTKAGPVWNGQVRLHEPALDQPLRWRKPRRIFVCAHGDLFHEAVPDWWIAMVFAVMESAPQHTFQILTKRPARMRAVLSHSHFGALTRKAGIDTMVQRWRPRNVWPLPNVVLGVSVEDQQRADERVPILLDTPAAVRFVSAEPLLGPVDFTRGSPEWEAKCRRAVMRGDPRPPGLDWIIVGGESGPGARPMHPDWARSIRDQCQAAGVQFFFKQWGEWAPSEDHPIIAEELPWVPASYQGMASVGKRAAGRLLDGRTWDEMPAKEAP